MAHGIVRRMVLLRALALPLLLVGCTTASTPEALELANIRPWNIVPNSSPARLAGSFARYCLDAPADADRVAAMLRAADHVEVPARNPRAIRSFLVDDNRPAVMVAADGRACAVAAQSRTGQTARIAALVRERFPGALPLTPAQTGPGVESGWALGRGQGLVLLRRVLKPGRPSELIVIRQRG